MDKTKGVDLALGSGLPGVSLLDGGIPKGGLEETSVEVEAEDSGLGMRFDELEDHDVTRK